MATLVIGDGHDLFAEALQIVLEEQGFGVVAKETTLAGTLASVGRLRPDLVLLARYFADGDGVHGVGELVASSRDTKVIVLTADRETDGMLRALADGASGYVHKTCGLHTLLTAIMRVSAGEVVVELPAGAPDRRTARNRFPRASDLTAREKECLELLAQGSNTNQMADVLGVSVTTVRTHVQSVLTKLGVHSRLEAVAVAVRHSLVPGSRANRQTDRTTREWQSA